MKNKIKNILGQGKRQSSKTLSFFMSGILVSDDLPFLTRRGKMLKSFVDIRHGKYVVKTAIVNSQGFIKTKTTDKFTDLAEANKKTDDLNTIWELLEVGKQMRMAGVR